MREFPLNLTKVLQGGLRRLEYPSRETPMMFDLYNMKPTQNGIVPYDPVQLPFDADTIYLYGLEFNWPYPQLFIGKRQSILAASTQLYGVDPNDWAGLAPIDTYDPDDKTATKNITAGSRPWELIDLGYSWFLLNGVDTVYLSGFGEMFTSDGIAGTPDSLPKVYVRSGMPIQAGCYHKARVFFGGFDRNNFWQALWAAFWSSRLPTTGLSTSRLYQEGAVTMPVDGNWIWWSSVGGGDILQFLAPQVIGSQGSLYNVLSGSYHQAQRPSLYNDTYSTTSEYLMDTLRKNQWGFHQVPVRGTVRVLKPLGEYVVCYLDGGVAAFRPASTEYADTMQRVSVPGLETVGVAHSCVAGDENHHIMLDNNGGLWHIDRDLRAEYLGYREWFGVLLPDPTLVLSHSQDPRDLSNFGEFYIGSQSKTYVLNKQGLFETEQRVTSATYYGGRTIGFAGDMSDEDHTGRVGVDLFDLQSPGLKTITGVAVRVTETREVETSTAGLQVALDYKTKKSSKWVTTAYKPLNAEGYARFPVTGVEFRLRIKTTKWSRVAIGGLNVDVQYSDARYRRGPGTPESLAR